MRRSAFITVTCLLLAAALAGCSEGDATGPEAESTATLTLNAETSWAYATLFGEEPRSVTVPVAETSAGWDIAFFGTSVMLNGGSAGPGNVLGYCICANASATPAQLQGFTPENQRAAFDAVTLADLPAADSAWQTDVLAPAISSWYGYNPVTHQVSAAPERSFYVRTADGVGFAKLHVTALAGATQETPGQVTIEYALQAAKGAAMGAVRTATITVPASGRVHFDLESGTQTTTGWDIAFEGYAIRVNGGVSGSGQAGAVAVTAAFSTITDASAPPATVYKADTFGGVFEAKKWYRYNITGNDHQVWPTFDAYLVKRGSSVYKLQVTSYYGPAGEARRITFRVAPVTQ